MWGRGWGLKKKFSCKTIHTQAEKKPARIYSIYASDDPPDQVTPTQLSLYCPLPTSYPYTTKKAGHI